MRWMWIDCITDHEPGHRLVAVKSVSLSEDHLHQHLPADEFGDALPIMPASLIIEGMAQTAGILVGSINHFKEKVILAKVVRAKLDVDITPGQMIQYDATIDRMDDAGAATTGTVCMRGPGQSEWTRFGHIELMFSHIDRNIAGIEFPEHNFVFSDNFRTILRAAGLEGLAEV